MHDTDSNRSTRRLGFKLSLAILAFWLSLALACNYPIASRRPAGVSGEALRQTLSAQEGLEVSSATAEASLTTAPGGTGVPTVAVVGGLKTATPAPDGSPVQPDTGNAPPSFSYIVQPGDTLAALSARFGVDPAQIGSPQSLPDQGLLPSGLALQIPNVLGSLPYPSALLPDSEIVYSPSVQGFNLAETVEQSGGYLSTYEETVDGENLTGVDVVQRVALELSVNPRLLLALLDFRSGWVTGQPQDSDISHPLGFYVPGKTGLYDELTMAGTHLNIGYYGWRQGSVTELKFPDGSAARLAPDLNAGSVALQVLFSKLYKPGTWRQALYGPKSFPARYQSMFGDPWERAAGAGALIPDGLAQPGLELPFRAGERWSFTGGPHASWNTGTPAGAIDFSPVTGEPACAPSSAWVTASAPGVVTRSGHNLLALDLDGDGFEGTGWVLLYLHLDGRDVPAPGTRVNEGDKLGHPSCERGRATGTHVHIARKYNGEWIPASGPLPFVLSGWEVKTGGRIYEGELVKDGQVVSANPGGSHTSIIIR